MVKGADSVRNNPVNSLPTGEKGESVNSLDQRVRSLSQDSLNETTQTAPSLKGRTFKWIREASLWIKNQFIKIFSLFRSKNDPSLHHERDLIDEAKAARYLSMGFVESDFPRTKGRRDHDGLYNMGNSCYINAGLQMLRTEGLLESLLENFPYDEESFYTEDVQDQRAFFRESLTDILNLLDESKSASWTEQSSINQRLNTALLRFRYATFVNQNGLGFRRDQLLRQQDGAEFLQTVLSELKSSIAFSKEISNRFDTRVEEYNDCQIRLNFDYSNGLKKLKTVSQDLQDLVDSYFDLTSIDDSEFTNKVRITNDPQFIPITLLRYTNVGAKPIKIKPPVNIENNGIIDFSSAFDEGDSKSNHFYKVVAFELHLGSRANSGHYISYRMDEVGQWREYDDKHVKKVSESEIRAKMGYAYNLLLKKV